MHLTILAPLLALVAFGALAEAHPIETNCGQGTHFWIEAWLGSGIVDPRHPVTSLHFFNSIGTFDQCPPAQQ